MKRYSFVVSGTLALFVLSLFFHPLSIRDAVDSGLFRARIYRSLAALLSGAILSLCGVWVQAYFRNDLASPSILGTTAGSTLGAQAFLLFLGVWVPPAVALSLGSLSGGLLALGIVFLAAKHLHGSLGILLFGFVLNAFFLAAGSFLLSYGIEDVAYGRALLRLSYGSFVSADFHDVALLLLALSCGFLFAMLHARRLDVLLFGEAESFSVGVDPRAERNSTLLWVALLTATVVAAGGNIAFVGLVVPHIARGFVGVSHKRVFLLSGWIGGSFMLVSDMLTRAFGTDTEIPVGIVTGILGAPAFAFLMFKRRLS